MRARCDKLENFLIFTHTIHQKPVWLDVALIVTLQPAHKFVRPVGKKCLYCNIQSSGNFFQSGMLEFFILLLKRMSVSRMIPHKLLIKELLAQRSERFAGFSLSCCIRQQCLLRSTQQLFFLFYGIPILREKRKGNTFLADNLSQK